MLGSGEMGKTLKQEPLCEYLLKTTVTPLRGCCIYLDPGTLSEGDDRKHWLKDPGGCGSQNNVSKLALHEQERACPGASGHHLQMCKALDKKIKSTVGRIMG